jgi:glycosyltransferase involved in cell wall biosynthesis
VASIARNKDARRTICVGRLHPTKGQDVLIRAIARLKDRFPDARFEFVGDGPCMDDCVKLAEELEIADRCRFTGRLTHDEVLRRLATSSVSVVPSRSECFGLVNIESLAVGTPVVASHVGGISEIVNDGEEGFLVPPDDPVSLAERLGELLGDPELRAEMTDKALQRFQYFAQQRLIGEQVDWLESLIP